jgi:hypothetical protein
MPQQSYHHQQYDKIRISYSFKDPDEKGLNASENYSTPLKKGIKVKKYGP